MHSAGIFGFYVFSLLALCALALVLGSQLVAHLGLIRGGRRTRFRPRETDPTPPISVLKPVKGLDSELIANLEAFLQQDYPEFEVIVGVQSANDPAIGEIQALIRANPRRGVSLRVGAPNVGVNQKVNNLAYIAQFARYDHLLISDADVCPGRNYLRNIAREAQDPRVGLVHSVLVATGERRLGAIMESLQMNTWVATAVCAADLVGHSCVIGKSMLFRRSLLEALGGFRVVMDVLAEDYLLGSLVQKAGYAVRLCTQPLRTTNPDRTVTQFASRHLRWCQMRRRIAPAAYVFELFMNPTCWLLLCLPFAALAPREAVGSWQSLTALGLMLLALKCVADEVMVRRLCRHGIGLRYISLVPLKDLLMGVIGLIGAFRRKVTWRGSDMLIGPMSRLFPLPEPIYRSHRNSMKRPSLARES